MKTLSLRRTGLSLKYLLTGAFSIGMLAAFTQTSFATPFLRTGTSYPTMLEDERIICGIQNGVQSLSTAECKEVARDFYREIFFQIGNFTPTGAFDVIRPTSIELFPDGSGFGKGIIESAPGYIRLLAGNFFTLSIENAFAYQVIDRDTVVFFGAPLFVNFLISPAQPVYIDNIQMTVYRRISGGLNDPSCRSAQNLTGTTCWAIMAELWSYQSAVGSGVSSTSLQVPPLPQPNVFLRTSTFPTILEEPRIICDSQTADQINTDLVWLAKCRMVAQEFYDQFHLDMSNYTGAGRLDQPASIELISDGSGYVAGNKTSELYEQMVGGNTTLVNVENAFAYKPIDENTVLVLGAPLLTVSQGSLSPLAYVHNIQLSVYRRTNEGLHTPQLCRSSVNPFGDDCWILVNKLWLDQEELGSGVSSTP